MGDQTGQRSSANSFQTWYKVLDIPKKVLEQLEKIRRGFLWETNYSSHKLHLMKWSEVTQPECNGILGFTNLTINNKCLLMKWLWSYGTGEQSLWKGMIKAKHGSKDNWSTNITNAPYGLGPWKFISKLGHDFSQKIHFKPGSESTSVSGRTNSHALKDVYPSIFNIAVDKNSSISQNRSNQSRDIHQRRPVQDWEMGSLIEM